MVTVIKKGMHKKEIDTLLERHKKSNKKKVNLEKYCGVLELKEDPILTQKNYAMNGNSILLETNIILYLLGGDKTLIPLLNSKQLFISFITQLELLSLKGLKRNEHLKIKQFLSECTVIDINSDIKELTINI